MRIISDFYDYYDGLNCYDSPLIYKRDGNDTAYRLTEGPLNLTSFRTWDSYHPSRIQKFEYYPKKGFRRYRVYLAIVGFCGKIYTEYRITGSKRYKNEETVLSTFSYDSYKEWGLKHIEGFRPINVDFVWTDFFNSYKDSATIPIFCAESSNKAWGLNPYVVGDFYKINCKLPSGFASVMPPYQAYQELSLFLGNYAAPDTVPALSNADNIERLGFDKKSSFRRNKAD
jgi:hypothetical protein